MWGCRLPSQMANLHFLAFPSLPAGESPASLPLQTPFLLGAMASCAVTQRARGPPFSNSRPTGTVQRHWIGGHLQYMVKWAQPRYAVVRYRTVQRRNAANAEHLRLPTALHPGRIRAVAAAEFLVGPLPRRCSRDGASRREILLLRLLTWHGKIAADPHPDVNTAPGSFLSSLLQVVKVGTTSWMGLRPGTACTLYILSNSVHGHVWRLTLMCNSAISASPELPYTLPWCSQNGSRSAFSSGKLLHVAVSESNLLAETCLQGCYADELFAPLRMPRPNGSDGS